MREDAKRWYVKEKESIDKKTFDIEVLEEFKVPEGSEPFIQFEEVYFSVKMR